jgi:hypothetical protein
MIDRKIGKTIVYMMVFVFLYSVSVIPLWGSGVPPLLDYPIHLARAFIVLNHNNEAIMKMMYLIDWRPVPNLGGDVLMAIMSEFFSIEQAGKFLICLSIFITVIGVVMLHRINFGYFSYWPLVSFFFAYHGALTAGFLNYTLGVAFLPIALAASIYSKRFGEISCVLVNSCSAFLLIMTHVIAAGLFGIALIVMECFQYMELRKQRVGQESIVRLFVCLAIPFVVPSYIYLKYSFTEVVSRDEKILLGEWGFNEKIRGALMPFLSGNVMLDIAVFAFFVVMLLFIFYSNKFIVKKSVMTCSVVFMILFVVLPGQMLDAAFIADRLTIASALIAVASLQPVDFGRRWILTLSSVVVIVCTARAWSQYHDWTESGRYYDRLAQSIEFVDRGASVMIVSPLSGVRDKGLLYWLKLRLDRPRWHFSLLNIPTLHAFSGLLLAQRSAFTQLHFVWEDKQILSLAPWFKKLNYGDGGDSTWAPDQVFIPAGEEDVAISDIADHFHYLLIVYADMIDEDFRSKIRKLSPVYEDDEIILLRNCKALASPSLLKAGAC